MNVNWSSYVQGINTLYYSRKLRFDDRFAPEYKRIMALDQEKPLKILEIGCGPGALAGALKRWYPKAEITGVDLDTAFIDFAKKHVDGVTFIEGDATSLPFEDETFDVTISNTVSEHIETTAFYGEQMRVLKKGGVCIVLSVRKGYRQKSSFEAPTEYENAFWEKISKLDDSMERFQVAKYAASEKGLMENMHLSGFVNLSSGYAISNLTPDNPDIPGDMAIEMINAHRYNDLDAIKSAKDSLPAHVTDEEFSEMTRLANEKYDKRIEKYLSGEKEWDTTVSIVQIARGVKPE